MQTLPILNNSVRKNLCYSELGAEISAVTHSICTRLQMDSRSLVRRVPLAPPLLIYYKKPYITRIAFQSLRGGRFCNGTSVPKQYASTNKSLICWRSILALWALWLNSKTNDCKYDFYNISPNLVQSGEWCVQPDAIIFSIIEQLIGA